MPEAVTLEPVALDAILARISALRKTSSGWVGVCPSHEDRAPSLSVRIGDDGRLLLHCFAGCRVEDIVAALGFCLRDLFPARIAGPPRRPAPRPRSPLDQARVDVLRDARRQQSRLALYRVMFAKADDVRAGIHSAAEARRAAMQLGDSELAWELLAEAAAVERETLTMEAELDQLAVEKHLP